MLDDATTVALSLLEAWAWSGCDIGWSPSFSTGDPPELSQVYESASQAIAEDPADVQAYFRRGVVCQSKRWYPQALMDLKEVIRRDPKHAQAWLLLSEVLASMGEYDKAKLTREQALFIQAAGVIV